jgi:EAL domain-containing protein (putative c-di-GMP-specific phosphodiesterase class I)
LPPQPPEVWVGRVWTALLAVAVAGSVAVSLARLGEGASARETTLATLHALAASAAFVAAHGLLIEDSVRSDRRLRWLAAGYATAAGLLVTRAVTRFDDVGNALSVLLLAAVPLYVLTHFLARRSAALLVLPAVVLAACAGAAFAVEDDLPDLVGGPIWISALVLGLVALVAWRGRRGPRAWISVSLLLITAAAGLRIGAEEPYDSAWWAGLISETAAFVLPGVGIGIEAAWGYGRQSRRWRQLETDVRALRTASPLLPGRSVTPDDDEGLPGRVELQTLIDAGLVRVAIQPVVALRSGTVVGHEALSRFGGRVPTDRWFKAASKYGLGGELERVTLDAALGLLAELPPSEFLAVNISPAALADAEVVRLLDDADLSRVVVEITEHEAVADYRITRAALGRLRRAGARIAVDDTGAGFASLRHVLMLQPDLIKLDTSLTRGIETDKRQQALVRAVTVFAAQVGADVLAEGIETEAQLDELRAIGVYLGQGWHLGVPVLAT